MNDVINRGSCPPMVGELPLRICIQPGSSPLIRCPCGLEAAVVVRSTINYSMTGLRSSGPARPRLMPDLSPAAVLSMVAHAQVCRRSR